VCLCIYVCGEFTAENIANYLQFFFAFAICIILFLWLVVVVVVVVDFLLPLATFVGALALVVTMVVVEF